MKKRQPSPFIAQMVEEFQKRHEESLSTAYTKKTTGPKPSHIRGNAQSSTSAAENAPTTSSPRHASSMADGAKNNASSEERDRTSPTVAPPKPPRMRENLPNSTFSEEERVYTPVLPPKTARVRQNAHSSTSSEENTPAMPSPQHTPSMAERAQSNKPNSKNEHTHAPELPKKTIRMRQNANSSTSSEERDRTHAPVLPPKTTRMRQNLNNSTSSEEDEHIYATVAPPKPPRVRENLQSRTSSKRTSLAMPSPQHIPSMAERAQSNKPIPQNEHTHAPVLPQKTARMKQNAHSSTSSEESATHETTATLSRALSTRAERSRVMQYNFLVDVYKEEIRYLCGLVYGNRLALDDKIEAVQENPAMGVQFSREIAENPESIAKFPGKQILGVKSTRRKKAEESFPSLCSAINGYVNAVQYVQENIQQRPQVQDRHHQQGRERQQTRQETQADENLQNPSHPQKKWAPLSNKEIAQKVQKDPLVQYGQTEVQYWCGIVFNNPNLLDYRTEDIQKVPAMGEELSLQLTENPAFFSPFAGKKVLGIKNEARKEAERNLSTLCSAVESYADTVKQVRDYIVRNHEAEKIRHKSPAEQAQNLQRKHTLSKSPKLREHTTENTRDAALETAKETSQHPPEIPRKMKTPKAMSLTC